MAETHPNMNSSPAPAALVPTIPGPDPDPRRPRIKLPAGACDCHAHVFGPQRQYPLAPSHGYVPPEASTDDFVRMLRAIGCERAVIVHPSIYGTDNRCTVVALRSGKFDFRGIAVIDHFGHIAAADGLGAPGFQTLLSTGYRMRRCASACWPTTQPGSMTSVSQKASAVALPG